MDLKSVSSDSGRGIERRGRPGGKYNDNRRCFGGARLLAESGDLEIGRQGEAGGAMRRPVRLAGMRAIGIGLSGRLRLGMHRMAMRGVAGRIWLGEGACGDRSRIARRRCRNTGKGHGDIGQRGKDEKGANQ